MAIVATRVLRLSLLYILGSIPMFCQAVLDPPVPDDDPIFETIDLNATYVAIRRIFARMGLSPKDMAVLIGGGHSSGQNTLEGGTYHGNWMEPMTTVGNAYFQLLTGHRQWCAVKSSDNGNAHFVAKGVAPYIAETEYSPLAKYKGKIPCVETAADKAMFDNLPTVPAEEMILQPGTWHKPSGATAMLPVDFALQYSNETYVHVIKWASDRDLFFADFEHAWAKLTENGQQLRCPNVNGAGDSNYSRSCAARFGADEAAYSNTWINIRSDIKALFDASPSKCKSIRPKQQARGGSASSDGSVCPSSILRLGFHISATYDPDTEGNKGGSNFANFLGPCALYDGCAGCLHDTQLALQRIQKSYEHLNVSLADVTIYAAGLAAAYLSEFKLDHMPFHPGRKDPDTSDSFARCVERGARLPRPAYQQSSGSKSEDKMFGGMLRDDLALTSETLLAQHTPFMV